MGHKLLLVSRRQNAYLEPGVGIAAPISMPNREKRYIRPVIHPLLVSCSQHGYLVPGAGFRGPTRRSPNEQPGKVAHASSGERGINNPCN